MEVGGNVDFHIAKCPLEPNNTELIQDLLHHLSCLGVISSQRMYDSAAREMDLAQSRFIKRVLGGWNGVASWAGLLPRYAWDPVRIRTARIVLCDLAEELHDGKHGPTQSEYSWYSPDGVPGVEMLRRLYDSWDGVLAWAGLPPCLRGTSKKVERKSRRHNIRLSDMPSESMLALEPSGMRTGKSKDIRYKDSSGRWINATVTTLL